MSGIVLIASSEHLDALKERDDLGGAQVFSDADALRALEVIMRERPEVVALERAFASTTRGAALVNRIKADPLLGACEIRIVSRQRRAGSPTVREEPSAAMEIFEDVSSVEHVPLEPLDQRGTRWAPRFRVREGIEVQIDGNSATLVDISTSGAQIISTTILRPKQRVRMALPDLEEPIRFRARVMWASLEMVKGGHLYRAGMSFIDANASALTRFCAANKR
jgi:hypothetical protein